jgi:Flp pilus assembly pilin Flp
MLKTFVALQLRLFELRDREDGQAFAEYGVLLAVVAIGMIVALGIFRGQIESAFSAIGSSLLGAK